MKLPWAINSTIESHSSISRSRNVASYRQSCAQSWWMCQSMGKSSTKRAPRRKVQPSLAQMQWQKIWSPSWNGRCWRRRGPRTRLSWTTKSIGRRARSFSSWSQWKDHQRHWRIVSGSWVPLLKFLKARGGWILPGVCLGLQRRRLCTLVWSFRGGAGGELYEKICGMIWN